MGYVVVGGLLEGSWGGCVCDGVCGDGVDAWRVHRVGVCVMVWVVVGWVVGGFMGSVVCDGVGGGGVGGWRFHGVGGCVVV